MQRLLNITPPARLTGVQMAGPTERNQGDKAEGEKLAGLVVLYSRGRAGGVVREARVRMGWKPTDIYRDGGGNSGGL